MLYWIYAQQLAVKRRWILNPEDFIRAIYYWSNGWYWCTWETPAYILHRHTFESSLYSFCRMFVFPFVRTQNSSSTVSAPIPVIPLIFCNSRTECASQALCLSVLWWVVLAALEPRKTTEEEVSEMIAQEVQYRGKFMQSNVSYEPWLSACYRPVAIIFFEKAMENLLTHYAACIFRAIGCTTPLTLGARRL